MARVKPYGSLTPLPRKTIKSPFRGKARLKKPELVLSMCETITGISYAIMRIPQTRDTPLELRQEISRATNVTFYCLYRFGGLSQGKIGKMFGMASVSAGEKIRRVHGYLVKDDLARCNRKCQEIAQEAVFTFLLLRKPKAPKKLD